MDELDLETIFSEDEIQALTENMSIGFLKHIVQMLSESYTPKGVRQWFFRPRSQLDDSSPYDSLTLDQDGLDKVISLVDSLKASGGT